MQVNINLNKDTTQIKLVNVEQSDIDKWQSIKMITFPHIEGTLIIPFTSICYMTIKNEG